jgi:hypothetical protein
MYPFDLIRLVALVAGRLEVRVLRSADHRQVSGFASRAALLLVQSCAGVERGAPALQSTWVLVCREHQDAAERPLHRFLLGDQLQQHQAGASRVSQPYYRPCSSTDTHQLSYTGGSTASTAARLLGTLMLRAAVLSAAFSTMQLIRSVTINGLRMTRTSYGLWVIDTPNKNIDLKPPYELVLVGANRERLVKKLPNLRAQVIFSTFHGNCSDCI